MKKSMIALAALVSLSAAAVAQIPPGSVKLNPNEAIVLIHNLAFYVEKDGGLQWKEGLVLGDKVTMVGGAKNFKVDGKEREYQRIKAPSGVDGWARSNFIASKAVAAVVKADDAIVYSEPRDVKITSRTISRMTFAAAFAEGGNADFVKLACYDAAKDAYYSDPVYVLREDVTFAEADIKSVILYATAMASKNKDIRANLFKVVEKKYSSSIFFDAIRAALVGEPVAASAPRPSAPAAGSFVVNDDDVNVRALPDEVSGQVVGKLSRGAKVEIAEATLEAYAVGGSKAPWYRIVSPAGWVYGAFLSPAP